MKKYSMGLTFVAVLLCILIALAGCGGQSGLAPAGETADIVGVKWNRGRFGTRNRPLCF